MAQDEWQKLRRLPPDREGLRRAAEVIQAASPAWTSVFLYGLEGDTLVLRASVGRPTEHERIPVGKGVCGRAVARDRNQRVDDVTSDPDYLACSVECRSECVVLVRREGKVVGQIDIDIDSDVPAAFSPRDLERLERAAALLAPLF